MVDSAAEDSAVVVDWGAEGSAVVVDSAVEVDSVMALLEEVTAAVTSSVVV